MSLMESEYLRRLLQENSDVGERYRKKVQIIGNVDPFTLTSQELSYNIAGVPPVTNMDIVAYLVLSHSFYTKDQMKAFKSLEAYKYFESGFVVKIGTKIINGFYVLVAKVKHSQRANLKPLDVWCIIAKDGSVCTAHCTCMAGNGEVCSHVGAILFSAEYAHTKKESVSCTDIQATWPMPSSSTSVPAVPIREIDWGKVTPLVPSGISNTNIPPISSDELNTMLNKIVELGHTCVLMRIVEPFASQMAAEAIKTLPLMFDIFQENNINKSYSELIQEANKIEFSISDEQKEQIEKQTRKQSSTQNWFLQRAGRITASKFKLVCKTDKFTPSLSLIKSICYQTKMFSTKATAWGISNEKNAVAAYEKYMLEENHMSFVVNKVGLLVNSEWPQLAASPDRIVYCECCLGGVLEVKCPYLLHTNNIENINEYINMKSSCLVLKDNEISIKKSHSYYYQVQMQIFVANLKYSDFVIWSPKIFFKLRVFPDFLFWERESKIALQFHAHVIMPELLGKYFSRQSGAAKLEYWCICNGVDDGRPMIRCDDDDCETQWFHFECVGLLNPDSEWYFSKCKKRQSK